MDDTDQTQSMEGWLSTYQWVTVAQLLDRYGLRIPEGDVLEILRKKTSFYYQFLMIPMGNVLNGIILDQAKEYRLFLQKLFVDYLVSGEADQTEESLGQGARKQMESERVQTISMSEKFEQVGFSNDQLIAKSQSALMAFATEFKQAFYQIQQKMSSSLTFDEADLHQLFLDANGFEIHPTGWLRFEKKLGHLLSEEQRSALSDELKGLSIQEKKFEEMSALFLPLIQQQRLVSNQYRQQFYDDIVRIQEVLYQVSGLKVDEVEDAKNRARLQFDPAIGAVGVEGKK